MLYILLLIVIIIILIRFFNREGFKEGVTDKSDTKEEDSKDNTEDKSSPNNEDKSSPNTEDKNTEKPNDKPKTPMPNNEIIFRKLDDLDKRLNVMEKRFEDFDNQ